MEINQKKDYLYRDNKYVNSDSIKFDKDYIKQLWIKRIVRMAVFFSIIIVGFILIIFAGSNKSIKINENTYAYSSINKNSLDINAEILYVKEDELFISKYLPFLFNGKSSIGKIKSLPLGIVTIDGIEKIVEDKQYAIECIDGNCEPGKVYIVKEEDMYGKVER